LPSDGGWCSLTKPFSAGWPFCQKLFATRIGWSPTAARIRFTRSFAPSVQAARSLALIPSHALE
jgi:hypothetical protein